eukprot:COSAG01_NODE_5065_length_4517_cov_11.071978_1_plen_89_part_00
MIAILEISRDCAATCCYLLATDYELVALPARRRCCYDVVRTRVCRARWETRGPCRRTMDRDDILANFVAITGADQVRETVAHAAHVST